MKLFVVLVLTTVVTYASATALPEAIHDGPIRADDGEMIKLEDVDTDGGMSTSTESSPIRHRRVTCDLLSVNTPWGGFNHAACAARCIAQRHKGGACRDEVCRCRG